MNNDSAIPVADYTDTSS